MIRARYALLLVVVAMLFSSRLWAWGCSGHEVVALIALQNLQKLDAANHTQTVQQVETLLATQAHSYPKRFCSDLGLDPIAYFATWADDHREADPATGNWHFWDIPLKIPTAKLGEYCDQGCVVEALKTQMGILQNMTKDQADRVMALMYVIHFVGDMHQPLHAEDNNDRGGNCVPVAFLGKSPSPGSSAGSFSPNLHGVWDTNIPENIGHISRQSENAKSELEAFASQLQTEHAAEISKALRGSINLVAWANESHQIARTDPYTRLNPAITPAPEIAPVTSCTDNNTSSSFLNKHETIDESYIKSVQGDVEGQLAKAGARLAAVLYSTLK